MQHVMFDIDGTLIQSYALDEQCFLQAVSTVTGIEIDSHWQNYPHVSDRGILQHFIETQAPKLKLTELESQVKTQFITNIKAHIESTPVQPIAGAVEFIARLQQSPQFSLSIATGGWLETALLKLESAGFNTDKLIIASSNDHFCRREIMNTSSQRARGHQRADYIYFGDAQWDIDACKTLGVKMILVGNRVEHRYRIKNYRDTTALLTLLCS